MATALVPFPVVPSHDDKNGPDGCPMFKMLPEQLQKQSQEKSHLWEYLHSLPMDKSGVPEYCETLGRKHVGLKAPNLIYPVGGGLFIHIYSDPEDSRDYYIAVEPGMYEDLTSLASEVDRRLVRLVHELESDATSEDRVKALSDSLDKICKVSDSPQAKEKNGSNGRSRWWVIGSSRQRKKVDLKGPLVLTSAKFRALRYVILRDKEGMGPLEPMIQDPYIEDISCSGLGPLFIEHKIFQSLKASVNFATHHELDSFVLRLSEKIGKPVTLRSPIVDATLPDGSRINIVYGWDVSKRGSNFTIRKFSSTPMSILQIVKGGCLSYEAAAYLSLVISHGMNLFVSGETASGKTTLLNAITAFIPSIAKIVSIEDTPELQVPHPNWIQETIRGGGDKDSGASVTMFDLLKAALRQRPNEIIIGEIRGEEGAIAFQAMQTGHACMATFHASSVEKLIQRLTGNPINVPKTYIDNLNVVVIQSMVRLPDGKDGRRVMSINEIIGYDSSSDSFSFIEVFRWDPITDTHEFCGYMNSHLLEERIAMRRGIPSHKKRDIYLELTRRAKILKRLADQGITDFNELFKILAKAHREGIFR